MDQPRTDVSEHIRQDSTLTSRIRELLIVRIGVLCRSEYEWAAHAPALRRAGMTDADMQRVVAESPTGGDPVDFLLLRATDELHRDGVVSEATWRGLAAVFDSKQMLDILTTIGGYRMVSMALNSFGVQLEPNAQRFPPRVAITRTQGADMQRFTLKPLVIAAASTLLIGVAVLAQNSQPSPATTTGRCTAATSAGTRFSPLTDINTGQRRTTHAGLVGAAHAAGRPARRPPRARRERWRSRRDAARAAGAGARRGAAAAAPHEEGDAAGSNPEVTPIVVNGVMYLPARGNQVLALDARHRQGDLALPDAAEASRRPRAASPTGRAKRASRRASS